MKYNKLWASQLAIVVMFDSAEDPRDVGSVPGWGRSLGGENGNPLRYSCLENSREKPTAILSAQGHIHVLKQKGSKEPIKPQKELPFT